MEQVQLGSGISPATRSDEDVGVRSALSDFYVWWVEYHGAPPGPDDTRLFEYARVAWEASRTPLAPTPVTS